MMGTNQGTFFKKINKKLKEKSNKFINIPSLGPLVELGE